MAYNGSTMAGVGGGDSKDPRPAVGGIMFFFTLMWIAGTVLLIVGNVNAADTQMYDPVSNWREWEPGCLIVSRTYFADQRQNNNPYCVDVYRYNFTVNVDPRGTVGARWVVPGNGVVYQSGADEKSRGAGTRCDDSTLTPNGADYSPNTNVTCWELAMVRSAAVSNFYDIGNDAHVKIINPQRYYDDAISSAMLLITLGSIFLGVGLPACGILGFFLSKMKKPSEAASGVELKKPEAAGDRA